MRRDIRDLIDDVVDAVVHDLTPGCVTVEQRGSPGRDLVVSIVPNVKESSPVIISYSGDDPIVFVEVGEATTIELYEPNVLREGLYDVLSTVVKNGFVERTWWHGGTLIYSEAELAFSKIQPGKISAQFGRRELLCQADMRERRYLPYE
ncbi:MAG TPA: hypothetical protein VHG90_09020 [Acidimicrobiales bacterium]|nr:hypothetical protein [Acidimicrobiales bacterium]